MQSTLVSAQDFVYSHTAKYRLTGENLVANGDFSSEFAGWTNELGGTVSSDFWSPEPAMGPQGENAAMSLDGGEADGNALVGIWDVDPGFYVIAYQVRAESSLNTVTTVGAANYLDVFLSTTGSAAKADGDVQVATAETLSDSWTQVAYPVYVEQKGQIVLVTRRLATGTMIANVTLSTAEQVYDTRVGWRLVEYAEQLLADENLPEGKDELAGALEGVIKPALLAEGDDLESLMDMFQRDILDVYLETNGTNVVGTTLTDWSTWGGLNYNNMTTRGTWTFEGGRWGFFPNDGFQISNGTTYLEFNPGDGYIATAGIQTGQNALNVGVRTQAGSLDALGPGKYFFSIEAMAVAASNRANPYGADHSIPIVGPNIYVGDTNEVLENDTLSGYYWKTYYKIAEIKEGEELKVGFHFPVLEGKSGGRYSLRNPQVRQIGVTAEDAAFNKLKSDFLVQQYNLGLRLANYPAELKGYAWELDSLTRAIEHAQPVYDASLLIIDADGNVLQRDLVNEEQTQLMLDEVNSLGRARNYVLTENAPIQNLTDAVIAGRESLDNPANANAQATKRTALEQAVAAGQLLLDNISSENQGEAFTAAAEAILNAKVEFEATTATRSNPTEIIIENGDFSQFSAGNNITSAGDNKSWNWTMAASTSRWEIRDNETLPQGHGASIWRGTTVGLDGKCVQRITLPYEGIYEYRAKAYISEERLGELVAAAEILYNEDGVAVDTLYTPNIRLFFGVDGRPDSITVSKCYLGVKADGSYFTREVSGTAYPGMVYADYSVFFTKTDGGETTVEFGLEAADNSATAGANGFGFGMNQVFYLGSEAQYLADTRAEMQAEVSAAQEAVSGISNYWVTKVNRYINDASEATTAKEMQNVILSLREVVDRATAGTNAVMSIQTNRQPASRQGVYTLTGIKVASEADGLKSGLYIVNGKKVAY